MSRAILLSVFFFLFSCFLFPCSMGLLMSGAVYVLEWKVATFGVIPVYFTVVFDFMALLFSFTVLFISANVMFFACGYMREEAYEHRFMILVFLFVLSMNILIFSSNLFVVLLGWDGLGLTSFLLVIYYQNSYSLGAGLITALTNRIGDVGLILAVAFALSSGHWLVPKFEPSAMIGALILLAAVTKSAQFPFSSWLPMAMAAPTPVSALVHSSTLVTAGVYLLIRFYPSLGQIGGAQSVLCVFSAITMVLAGITAFFETDFKKIIALSTLSQLGVMVGALGLGSPLLAFFHLLSHAMFKALLFICAGSYIYYHKHGQDFRDMGNLAKHMPITQVAVTVANLALSGLPFLAGFYSKDLICEFGLTSSCNVVVLIMLLLGVFLTSAYSMRAVVFSQLGEAGQQPLGNLHNGAIFFSVPAVFLGITAISWGAALNWLLLPPAYIGPLSSSYAVLPVSLLFGGILGTMGVLSQNRVKTPYFSGKMGLMGLMHEGITSIWFLAPLSSQQVISGPLSFGVSALSVVDQGWLEMVSGVGAVTGVRGIVQMVQPLHKSLTTTFLFLSLFTFFPVVLMVA